MVLEMGEKQFAERYAADQLDSLDNSRLLAEIASLVDLLIAFTAAGCGVDPPATRTPKEFLEEHEQEPATMKEESRDSIATYEARAIRDHG